MPWLTRAALQHLVTPTFTIRRGHTKAADRLYNDNFYHQLSSLTRPSFQHARHRKLPVSCLDWTPQQPRKTLGIRKRTATGARRMDCPVWSRAIHTTPHFSRSFATLSPIFSRSGHFSDPKESSFSLHDGRHNIGMPSKHHAVDTL